MWKIHFYNYGSTFLILFLCLSWSTTTPNFKVKQRNHSFWTKTLPPNFKECFHDSWSTFRTFSENVCVCVFYFNMILIFSWLQYDCVWKTGLTLSFSETGTPLFARTRSVASQGLGNAPREWNKSSTVSRWGSPADCFWKVQQSNIQIVHVYLLSPIKTNHVGREIRNPFLLCSPVISFWKHCIGAWYL